MALHLNTPLLHSPSLSDAAGCGIWLKLDALQPTGSFKIRGIGAACETYARQGKRRFIASSGGNAGIAVAYAGRSLGVPVTVVVPETTSARARALIQAEQAQLIVHGAAWHEAHAHALSLMGPQDAFLHPFDDAMLWQGHASLVDEVAASGWQPDAVVLSVGGGGLFSGVVAGLQRQGWHQVPVIAAETRGADALARSLQQGQRVALPAITSIATSLGARQVCEQAWTLAQQHPVHSAVVSDRAAVQTCERFLDEHRILVEPACGASLALAYGRHAALQGRERVLVVVCGGATSTVDQWRAWLASDLD